MEAVGGFCKTRSVLGGGAGFRSLDTSRFFDGRIPHLTYVACVGWNLLEFVCGEFRGCGGRMLWTKLVLGVLLVRDGVLLMGESWVEKRIEARCVMDVWLF